MLKIDAEEVHIGLQSKAALYHHSSLKFYGKGIFFQLNILSLRAVAVFSNSIWNLDP